MRAVVQRVSRAEVRVEGEVIGSCGAGVMVLLGVHAEDAEADADWLARKVAEMRIFSDEDGKMNRALTDFGGEALVVSQFTLHAKTKKAPGPASSTPRGPKRPSRCTNGSSASWKTTSSARSPPAGSAP